MKSLITLSKVASRKLCDLLKSQGKKDVLFSVESGGCNGLTYSLQPTSNIPEKTDTINIYKDYNLHLCQKSSFYLLGTHIDWQNDFMGQTFIFNNPNENSSCGCGKTFNI